MQLQKKRSRIYINLGDSTDCANNLIWLHNSDCICNWTYGNLSLGRSFNMDSEFWLCPCLFSSERFFRAFNFEDKYKGKWAEAMSSPLIKEDLSVLCWWKEELSVLCLILKKMLKEKYYIHTHPRMNLSTTVALWWPPSCMNSKFPEDLISCQVSGFHLQLFLH